ncbi:MAG TPA: phosphoenolpyruvate--protein phosphotransferase [Hydrogenispora sp.]|nr:phosphoenolpyruvate--protein phosphotransferase [Hydrogenispora sp.]
MYKGVPASPGIALGPALVLPKKQFQLEKKIIQDVTAEKDRFHQALTAAKTRIEGLIALAQEQEQTETAKIFEAHRMVLEDPELITGVEQQIDQEKVNAEFALETTVNFYINLLSQANSAYMRERVADLKDVANQVLQFLAGGGPQIPEIKEDCIIVAAELTPSDTALLPLDKVQGFITEVGGPTSHTAIIARSLELPAVVGVKKITASVQSGDHLIIDGEQGAVFVNPDSDTIAVYRQKQEVLHRQKKELASLKTLAAQTKSGKTIKLLANVGEPWELPKALEYGADGIGLFRTEYLFLNRDTLPTEEEQFQAYKEVLVQMEGKPVVIRTLDIGGDKNLPSLNLETEMNPFLGLRGIRLCLKNKTVFTTQLRALYRASVHGQLKIMFPMISSLEEYRAAVKCAEEVRAQLIEEGHPVSGHVPIGIMVEVPSTAIMTDLFAKEVDFVSIGTNDLTQYTLAVDRMNEQISHLYTPFHPAVLRLIKMVIAQARDGGIEVSMCGEMAGDPRFTSLLIGLGLESFSMSPSALLAVKKQVRAAKSTTAKALAQKVLALPTAEEIRAALENAEERSDSACES